MDISRFKSRIQQSLITLPFHTHKLGHVALVIGLSIFGIALFAMITHLGPGADRVENWADDISTSVPNVNREKDLAYLFQIAGYFIVPGWLLMRLADGLFPFSLIFTRREVLKSD